MIRFGYGSCDDHLECHNWDITGYPGDYLYGDDVYVGDYYLDERWLPVGGYRGDYWVSTHGRVWSNYKHRFLSQWPGDRGHLYVELYANGHKKSYTVHRLMAEEFIPNPHQLPMVRHLDDDPANNHISNLAWGTQVDNMRDAIDNGHFYYLTDDDREKAMSIRRMPIDAMHLRTGETARFSSQQEAARTLGVDQSSISDVLRKRKRHVKGWVFTPRGEPFDNDENIDTRYYAKLPLIRATNVLNGEEYVFRGLTNAARNLDMSIASISNVLRGKQKWAKSWYFEYIEEDDE